MLKWRRGVSRAALLAGVSFLVSSPVLAASFSVDTGTDTGAKTVTGTETGTVQSGATLNVSGTAITWTGPSNTPGVTINNYGTIQSGSRGIDTSGANPPRNLTLNNYSGGLISTVDDAFRLNTSVGNGTVTVNNSGTIVSSTGQVFDFANNNSATGTVRINNSATGILRALGNDAIRPGSGTTIINNSGLIDSTASANRGINLNVANLGTVTSFQVVNNAGGVIQSQDDAIRVTGTTLATTGTFSIDNAGTILSTVSGQAIDFNDISSGTVSIINRATGVIRSTNADAVRPGQGATVTNYGLIYSDGPVGSSNDGIDWQSHSGTVVNKTGGTISGFRHGITTDADVNVTNEAGATIIGRNGSGVGSDGTGTVTNYGRITGAYNGSGTGDGDGVDVDFAATITNYGIIEGTGAGGFDSGNRANNSEGISIGGGSVTNSGTISGASYGIVVNNDSNPDGSRSGVAATTITNNAGGLIVGQNGFAIRLENKTGTAADNDTIVNRGTIIGNGTIPDPTATVLLGDGVTADPAHGTLNGVTYGPGSARFIRGDGSAIQTGEGNDVLTNYGTIIGNTGRAINFEGGNDTLNVMAGSRIVGLVDGGVGTDTLNYNKVGLTDAKRTALEAGQTVNIGGTLYTSFEVVNGAALSFSSFATTPGALGIANILDNGSTTVSASPALVAAIDSIASSPNVGAALSQLSPGAYQALSSFGFSNAQQTSSLIGQQITDARLNGVTNNFSGASNALALLNDPAFAKRGLMSGFAAPDSLDTVFGAFGLADNTLPSDAMAYTKAPSGQTIPAAADRGVFLLGNVAFTHQGARTDAPETRSTTANVVGGVNGYLTDRVFAGVFGGYAHTTGDLDNFGSNTTVNTGTVGVFGSYQADRWFATATAFHGWSGYDNTRNTVGGANTSSFNGTNYAVRGTVGTDIRYGQWLVTPEVGVQYMRVMLPGFTETGVTALSVGSDNSDSLRSSLGARFAYDYRTATGVLTPELRLGWQHEFNNGIRNLSASFIDPGFAGTFFTPTGAPVRDLALVGAGITGKIGAATYFSVNYDLAAGSDDTTSHAFTGKLRYAF